MIPLIMSVWFGKWKALVARVAAAPLTHLLRGTIGIVRLAYE